ncbi:ras-related and estrogen-regulated growth inhibitor-like [Neocloeon triangulifer]|uniref:ras-related and estrogen-regulated growth inhibitor-like n=1 Tax=Neocloeon triangulifer TaxID=2078957 RepID=UPI00286F10D7|nr:ras-related and estrogen-regulated growth inhibitor-like [Neocloeon triangulifer]
MTNLSRIKVVVLGTNGVGKSAVTVRYLTKRYIGEYSSGKDMTYQHQVTFDSVVTEIEILDTSMCSSCVAEHLKWGDAFVVVYSVEDKTSFQGARKTLQSLSQAKECSFFSLLLLGNKRDLDYMRQVGVDDGQELSLKFGCQFYEVSAAENSAGVTLAFMSLLREARSAQLLRNLPIRRKLGVNSVSKVLGTIFGKNSSQSNNSSSQSKKDRKKKRPSLSI